MMTAVAGSAATRPAATRPAVTRCVRALVLGALCALGAMPAMAEVLSIEGEVYARESAVLMPPKVEGVWQFNITRLAADGAPVEKGEPVLAFDGNELMQDLTEKTSKLAEKQRALDTLLLELAARAREEKLATAEARAALEKARRKTELPPSIIPGIEYRKLVIAREQAEKTMALMRERERLAAEQRRQERRLLESEVAQLQSEVAQLKAGLASLTITAPRSGLMMHKSSWNGEKFDVGSQVFRGQSVAEIPDPTTLAVRAQLPERDLNRVRVGAPVRIVVEGGAGVAVAGTVTAIGNTVRSKSRVRPVPVVDLEIELADADAPLKPGQAVRVVLKVADKDHAAAGRTRTDQTGAGDS